MTSSCLQSSSPVNAQEVSLAAPLDWSMRILAGEISPVVAGRMSRAVAEILQWTVDSAWPEVAWSFSRLTSDGFPFEFSLSSLDGAVRYTAEVAGAEVAENDRLPRTLELIKRRGGGVPTPYIRTLLQQVQATGRLSYGAWIGGRHDSFGDRFKVYVEVPRSGMIEGQRLVKDMIGNQPLLNRRDPEFRLIGYEPISQRIEFYFQIDRLETWELERLMCRFDVVHRQTDLLDLLEESYGRSARSSIPDENLGFSCSISLAGGPTTFSLFTYARSVFGGDAKIRRRLLDLAKQRPWDLGTYERLTAPLANQTGWNTSHGLLAFVVPPEGPLFVQIGLRPCEASART